VVAAGSPADGAVISAPHQPIVILGGFLITQEAYQPMRQRLAERSGQPLERVELVPVGRLEWLLTVLPSVWARILDRVALAVERQARLSPTGRVTLVGHSSGGIMLRLYLDGRPFLGRCYGGHGHTSHLLMLGSPHTALRATAMRQRVDRLLPGTPYAAPGPAGVRYLSVAGSINLAADAGEASATARRLAPTAYRNSTGRAEDPGDGLVPVASALLAGSQQLVLKGVAHGGAFGPRWYGTPEVVEQWWRAIPASEARRAQLVEFLKFRILAAQDRFWRDWQRDPAANPGPTNPTVSWEQLDLERFRRWLTPLWPAASGLDAVDLYQALTTAWSLYGP